MDIEDFKNESGEWAGTKTCGDTVFTVGGRYYHNMRQRCKVGGSKQRDKPTYVGCTTTFKSCHDFIEWGRKQVGYGTGELDKDILLKGNKVYCPELCVFVPRQINLLLVSCNARRGAYPLGVSYNQKAAKFVAQLRCNGKVEYLGLFNSPEAAFAAYKTAKEGEIKRVANLHFDNLDSRVFTALMSYNVGIND